MKHSFNPEIAYIIGLWHASPSKKGLGVCGKANVLFADLCLKNDYTAPRKILYERNCIYFYNTKLKKFFLKVLEERRYRLAFFNDYSASYFAGMFDGNGGRDERGFFIPGDDIDEWLLDKLKFGHERRKKYIYPLKQIAFIKFIYEKTKLNKPLFDDFI